MKKKLFMIAAVAMSAVSGASYAACSAANTAGPAAGWGTAAAPALVANTCVCDGVSERMLINGGSGSVVDPTVAQFIRNGFVVQCSANSMVTMSDLSPTQFAIAGASRRGNQLHIGSSNGGSVSVPPSAQAQCTGTDANRTCDAGNVTTALGLAVTQAQQ
jgi:hypothetical protein